VKNDEESDSVFCIENDTKIVALPYDFRPVRHLILKNCPRLKEIPDRSIARKLEIIHCPEIRTLPAGLNCNAIIAHFSNIVSVPDGIQVSHKLDLQNSVQLRSLPAGLQVGVINLRGCLSLTQLPCGLKTSYLDLSECSGIFQWPDDLEIGCGHLNLAGSGFYELPPGLRLIARLDIRNCPRIKTLPEGLEIRSWVDVAGSGLRMLPKSCEKVRIRWRGVNITSRIAFEPESIQESDILNETNAEVRRVMLERVGFERFFEKVKAEVLDEDRDPGGPRRLLKIALPNDEPLVCISMSCPSTARRYVLRVPPTMASCRQAAAWMAGFDNPDDYAPLVET
jgi:hypothetical protein